jgi:hypothetical protein
VSIDAANAITPAFDWGAWFDANGVARPAQFSLSNPDFFRTLDGMFASVPMEDWKAYFRFHTLDGLSMDCGSWWANIRMSNTEPLLRLNLEARDAATVAAMVRELEPILGHRVEH